MFYQSSTTNCIIACHALSIARLFVIDREKHGGKEYIPVTKINIQFTRRIIDAQIPPKTFACQKSIRRLKISVTRIICRRTEEWIRIIKKEWIHTNASRISTVAASARKHFGHERSQVWSRSKSACVTASTTMLSWSIDSMEQNTENMHQPLFVLQQVLWKRKQCLSFFLLLHYVINFQFLSVPLQAIYSCGQMSVLWGEEKRMSCT